jgi:hypothetical protein
MENNEIENSTMENISISKIENKIENIDHSTAQQISQTAVKLILGKENQYIQNLLTNRLEGIPKSYTSTPVSELVSPPNRNDIKNTLNQSIEISQQSVVDLLKNNNISSPLLRQPVAGGPLLQSGWIGGEAQNSIAQWIINVILQEKLNYREVRETSDRWKNCNGILAIVLPIIVPVITGILQHYIYGYTCNCSNS